MRHLSLLRQSTFALAAIVLLGALMLGVAAPSRAAAAGPITVIPDMVEDGRTPALILGADEGIPVVANGRVVWLYFYGCNRPYWNRFHQAVRACSWSVRTRQGQSWGRLLGNITVWFRWDGSGYNEVIHAVGRPLR